MDYSVTEGEMLIKYARNAISNVLEKKTEVKLRITKQLLEKRGVFVTLNDAQKKELRGCIGYPHPTLPLIEATMDAAIHAAMDPRFAPVKAGELDRIVVEVTVLGELEKLGGEPGDYVRKIKIGKHGLFIDAGVSSGLLLPQVAVEQKWGAEEFLSETCWKAGIDPSAWLDPAVKVYRFEGQIFAEEKPNGKVVEKK
jgi:uncharacterized protein (TIGR00296 family)